MILLCLCGAVMHAWTPARESGLKEKSPPLNTLVLLQTVVGDVTSMLGPILFRGFILISQILINQR